MNVLLLVAFGLVALGAVIRLVLFLTSPKKVDKINNSETIQPIAS